MHRMYRGRGEVALKVNEWRMQMSFFFLFLFSFNHMGNMSSVSRGFLSRSVQKGKLPVNILP